MTFKSWTEIVNGWNQELCAIDIHSVIKACVWNEQKKMYNKKYKVSESKVKNKVFDSGDAVLGDAFTHTQPP